MRAVIKASGISKEEVSANPQEVLAVIQFHMDGGPTRLRHKHTVRKNITQAANIKQDDYNNVFNDLKNLGHGASGIVYAAKDKRTGERVALKIAATTELADLINEIGLQSMSRHPNIVQTKECYVSKKDVCIFCRIYIYTFSSLEFKSDIISSNSCL